MFVAGVVLLTTLMLRLALRRSRTSARAAAHPIQLERPRPGDLDAELRRSQVEMHELLREWKAELDNKMRALQLLILEAEQKQQQLERLLDELHTGGRGKDEKAEG